MWFSGPQCLCLKNGGIVSYLDLISKIRKWICYAFLSTWWWLRVEVFLLSCYNIEKVDSKYSCYAATVIWRGTFLTHRDATTSLHQIEGEPCNVGCGISNTIGDREKNLKKKHKNNYSNLVFIITFTGHLKYDISSPEMIPRVASISEETVL